MASKMISKWNNAISGGGGLSLTGGADHGSLLGDHHTSLGDGDGDEDGKTDSLGYNNMLLRPDGTVMTKDHIKELRDRQGFCLTCEGEPTKLFSIKKSKLNPLWKGKEPINTIHVSYDGTCLKCNPQLDPHQASRTPDNARNSMIPGTLHTMIPREGGGTRRRASIGSVPQGAPTQNSINSIAAAAAAAAAGLGYADAQDNSPSPAPNRPPGPSSGKPGASWSPHRPPQRSMSPRPVANRTTSDLGGSGHSGRGPISLGEIKRNSNVANNSGRLNPPRSDSKGFGVDGRSERSLKRSNSGDNMSKSDHSRNKSAPKRASSTDGMLESTEEDDGDDQGFPSSNGKSKWDDAFAGFLKPPPGDVPKISREQASINATLHAADAFKSQLGGVLKNRRKSLERSNSIDSDGFLEEPSKSKIETDLGFNNSFMDFGSPARRAVAKSDLDSGSERGEDVEDIMDFLESDGDKKQSVSSASRDNYHRDSMSRASNSGSEMDDTTEELKFADDVPASPAKRRHEVDTVSMQSVQETADWQDEMADDMDLIKGVLSSLAGDATERLSAIEAQVKKLAENQMALMEQNASILLLLQANAAATSRLGSTRSIQQARPMPGPEDVQPSGGLKTPFRRGPHLAAESRASPTDMGSSVGLKTSIELGPSSTVPTEPGPVATESPVAAKETIDVANISTALRTRNKSPSPGAGRVKKMVEDSGDLLLMSPGVVPPVPSEKKQSSSRSSSRKKSRHPDVGLPRRSSKRSSRELVGAAETLKLESPTNLAQQQLKNVEFQEDGSKPSDPADVPSQLSEKVVDVVYEEEPLTEPSTDETENAMPLRVDMERTKPPLNPTLAMFENGKQKSSSSNKTETSGESEMSHTNSDPLTDDGGDEFGEEKDTISARSVHSQTGSNKGDDNVQEIGLNSDGVNHRPLLGDSDKRESKRKDKKKSGKKDKKEKRSSRKIRAESVDDMPEMSDFGRIEEH